MNFTRIVLFVLLFTFCLSCKFTLFEEEEKLLDKLMITQGDQLFLYYLGLGATTDNVVQLRRQNGEKSEEEILKVFPGYTKAEFLMFDSSGVSVVLNNEFPGIRRKADTLFIEIED